MVIIYNYTKLNKLNTIKCTTVSNKSKPHLFWEWNDGKMFGVVYSYFLLLLNILAIYGLEKGLLQAGIINIGFIASYIIYNNTHSVGAMWCFLAAFAPWIHAYLVK